MCPQNSRRNRFFCAVDKVESPTFKMMRPILLAWLSVSCALAQPPNLIRLVRQGTIGPYITGQAPVNVLAMTAMAGPANF